MTTTNAIKDTMTTKTSPKPAHVLREYGPFDGIERVHGVTHDGSLVWFAYGEKMAAFDPASGEIAKSIPVASDAGTAYDGTHLYQLAGEHIQKVEPSTGRIVATIPAPGGGNDSGMTWADGTLWVGQYKDRSIHQIDAETGAILNTLRSDRFVTGISWVDGELWHGTWENDASEIRRVDPQSGRVLEALEMPQGTMVSGLEAKGDVFYCGGGSSGKVRAVRRPTRGK